MNECGAVLLVGILALRCADLPDPHGCPQAHRRPQAAGGHDGAEIREDVQRPRRIRYDALKLVSGGDPKRQPGVDGVRKSMLNLGERFTNDRVEFPAVGRTVARRTDNIRRKDRDWGACACHTFCTHITVQRLYAPISGCKIRHGRTARQASYLRKLSVGVGRV